MKIGAIATIAVFVVIGGLAKPVLASDVVSIACKGSQVENECIVKLQGTVSSDDVLLMPYVADIDITSYNGKELGRTGFLFGRQFYAGFMPRMYSLASLAGTNSPEIVVHSWTLWSFDVGVSPNDKSIRVVAQKDALPTYLWQMASPFLISALIFAIGIYALSSLRVRLNDGWAWKSSSLFALYFGGTFFAISMTRILRVVIPTLMTRCQHYAFHGSIEAITICALTALILEAEFVDPTSIQIDQPRLQTTISYLKSLNILICLFVVYVMCFRIGTIETEIAFHPRAVFVQSLLAIVSSIIRLAALDIRKISQRAMYVSSIFLVCQLATTLILLRDSLVYMWFRHPGEQYYIQYSILAVMLVGSVRSLIMQKCERSAKRFADQLRIRLRNTISGEDQIEEICKSIESEWSADRVTVVSIIGEDAMIVKSVGESARPIDLNPKPIGPLVQILRSRQSSIYISAANEFSSNFANSSHSRSCFLIPLIKDGSVVAALSLMAKHGTRLVPYRSRQLDSTSAALESEIIGAINNVLLERSKEELKQFAVGMSGLVFEHMNAWGQMKKNNPPSRRVVVSADGLKTTCLDQIGAQSPLIFSILKSYRAEIYAGWIAIKQVFELVSSDVHGDDFWIVSPLKFKDPDLAALGAERVSLIVAALIEQHSREVASRPEFRVLARFGSHVAVGAGMIELVALGTADSMCPDIHGHIMSRMHRIRSEADPGFVLVDIEDEAVRTATLDESLFLTRPYSASTSGSEFKDLHSHPSVVMLVGLRPNELITRKLEIVKSLIEASPYLNRSNLEGAA